MACVGVRLRQVLAPERPKRSPVQRHCNPYAAHNDGTPMRPGLMQKSCKLSSSII